jgi:preprotein translocase subunit SecD
MVCGETQMKITFKIWILIFFVLASLISIFSIPPTFMDKGVLIRSIETNSSLFDEGFRSGTIITEINGETIQSLEHYSELVSFQEERRTVIKTKQGSEAIGLFSSEDFSALIVGEIPSTRIQMGLDLQGGARALVSAEEPLTDSQVEDLIDLLNLKFNLNGLTDIQIRKVSDLSGANFILIEIAGSSPSDLEEMVSEQGKFEAKIGDKVVFTGGNNDITRVARSNAEGAGVYDCQQRSQTEWICLFRFPISLSSTAADNYGEVTKDIPINSSSPDYLEQKIDFYLDDILTDSLFINKDLKGSKETQHSIQGSGSGATQQEAKEQAEEDMKKLQTVLITGSLPFKLQIDKIDRISPRLGGEFTKQILFAGLFAFLAVGLIVLIRYRKIKFVFAQMIALFSEITIILGFAALIKWNLDLPSIAGIIAAIGTGMDSQIVILDESQIQGESLKQRIKKALFIIVTAFTTTFVALIPLTGALRFMGIGAASAGLLKGFAVTTLIGISVGVLISRPAFADMVRQIGED